MEVQKRVHSGGNNARTGGTAAADMAMTSANAKGSSVMTSRNSSASHAVTAADARSGARGHDPAGSGPFRQEASPQRRSRRSSPRGLERYRRPRRRRRLPSAPPPVPPVARNKYLLMPSCSSALSSSQRSLFRWSADFDDMDENTEGPVRKRDDRISVKYCALQDADQKTEILQLIEVQLQDMEKGCEYRLEPGSVYGAVVALPQVARSMGWPWTMVAHVIRLLILLAFNYLLQGSAIMFVAQASQIVDVFSGKMHLCDFAYHLEECPGGRHCTGPGGTQYTPSRLHGFDIWSVRQFMRDTLAVALKGSQYERLVDQVHENFDPGEFGMENYYCRFLASLIFMTAEIKEFCKTAELIVVLWKTPSRSESWVYRVHCEHKDPTKSLRFITAGIPRMWKVFYFVFLVLPKSVLLYNVCWMGLRFLMETAGIFKVLMSAAAMDFILNIDELLFDYLGSVTSKRIMSQLKGFPIPGDSRKNNIGLFQAAKLALPSQLIMTLLGLLVFEARYYLLNCEFTDGMWVSKPMYLPKSAYYTFVHFITGKIEFEGDPIWQMPSGDP